MQLFAIVHMLPEIIQDLFENLSDRFASGSRFLGEMDYKAAWNARFPGVIVFVEKHFLVSLQDLSLDILHWSQLFLRCLWPTNQVLGHQNKVYFQTVEMCGFLSAEFDRNIFS